MVRHVRTESGVRILLSIVAALGLATGAGTQAAQVQAPAAVSAAASRGLGQTFRGLLLRTHPNRDAAASQVYLAHAEEIVMNDGARVEDWPPLAADIGATGAGGLDVGSKVPSAWYEIHAIRSSRTDTRNLLLHRATDYRADQSQPRTPASENLGDTTARTALAQGFQVGVRGRVEFVDVSLRRNGSPAGSVWLTIESTAAGRSAAATSDRLDASKLPGAPSFIRFVFRTPVELTASTDYRLVLHGDFAVHPSNHVSWLGEAADAYPRGSAEQGAASAWIRTATVQDFAFTVYVTQNDGPVVMPEGFDERAKIGYVHTNDSGAFNGFVAMDREVMPLDWAGTAELANKSPVLFDLRSFIPPGTIRLELSAANTQAPNRVWAGPVPAGFDARATDANRSEGGQTSVMVTFPSDAQSVLLGRVITEYQGSYFFTTGGRARVYISMWAW